MDDEETKNWLHPAEYEGWKRHTYRFINPNVLENISEIRKGNITHVRYAVLPPANFKREEYCYNIYHMTAHEWTAKLRKDFKLD